jgi:hygromycin-B 7''-O-kinase
MLPADIGVAEYRALRRDPARWLGPVRALCAGLGYDAVSPVAGGSNLIAELGREAFIKVFPPFERGQFESERRALAYLHGRVSFAIPQLVHHGTLDGWPYVITSRVAGVTLEDAWPRCDRAAILHQLGAVVAEVHALDASSLADLDPPWPDFITAQRAGCAARHARLGLPAQLVAELDRYLAPLPEPQPHVVLTGEYTPDNVMVIERDGRWAIAGLIDFGDVMVGLADYDLVGPCTFLAAGDAELCAAFFAGYGRAIDAHRLLTLLLLHRFSNLELQLRLEGWKTAPDLAALARLVLPD